MMPNLIFRKPDTADIPTIRILVRNSEAIWDVEQFWTG